MEIQVLEQLYEGKAKKVFKTNQEDLYMIEYKDDATAFNGEKKEEFDKKGILNNTITSFIFEYLERNGIETHFIKKVNDTDQICKHVKIIPLEVITRNIVAGSMAKRYGLEEGMKLKKPIFELSYKNDELNDPLINDDHAIALGIVSEEELSFIKKETEKINELLKKFFLKAGLILVDFKIEFGKTSGGKIILSDEISPDTCRLWDVKTRNKLDKDRFRRNLGSVMDAYEEVLRRITSAWN